MNASPLANRRAINQAQPAPVVLWTPPEPTDPAFGRWYEEQEMLDATYRVIPGDPFDYFEEIGHD